MCIVVGSLARPAGLCAVCHADRHTYCYMLSEKICGLSAGAHRLYLLRLVTAIMYGPYYDGPVVPCFVIEHSQSVLRGSKNYSPEKLIKFSTYIYMRSHGRTSNLTKCCFINFVVVSKKFYVHP